MKVAVIGSGGREHAIIKKLKQSKEINAIYAIPGNGGMTEDAILINIPVTDINGICNFAKQEKLDYVVVAPDDPLVAGMVDALNSVGIDCFGPDKKAAIIEGSKVFSKDLMKKYNIPTAAYGVYDNLEEAIEYLRTAPLPTVIKADGLALGKGVIIAETLKEAENAVRSIMEDKVFGASGNKIVIEEFLTGPEVSVLAFSDGKTLVPMVSAMDHKRAKDNDKGLNTGGMGTIAPNPYYTKDVAKICMDEIFIPTIRAMENEGRAFKGCLFFGLMITPNGPKVIEYNCRFGDPETQVVLPLLDSDLFEIMRACTNGTLDKCEVKFKDGAACCVVMASNGYPEKYQSGFPIIVDKDIDATVYFAGAKKDGDKLLSAGGRVLGVSATADTLDAAINKAYKQTEKVNFENAYKRNDIGSRALAALK
ncbi:MAG: phosphoribosylamine--glycine ligase [Ruminococcaceae bacterium]|nr:phosphoribosylamine--glycine ligase [Oscillospiraceae bacterium]